MGRIVDGLALPNGHSSPAVTQQAAKSGQDSKCGKFIKTQELHFFKYPPTVLLQIPIEGLKNNHHGVK